MGPEKTIHIILDPGPRSGPSEQNGSLLRNYACLTVNDVGKPCEVLREFLIHGSPVSINRVVHGHGGRYGKPGK
jgi:hypothetical protein